MVTTSKDALQSIRHIPCYQCILDDGKMVSPHRCNPNKCTKLDKWILGQIKEKEERTKRKKMVLEVLTGRISMRR